MDQGWEIVLGIVFVTVSTCFAKVRHNNMLSDEHESSYRLNASYILFNVFALVGYFLLDGRYITVIHFVKSARDDVRKWMVMNFEIVCFVVSSSLATVFLSLSVYSISYDVNLSTVLAIIGVVICFTMHVFALNTANFAIYALFVWTMRVGSFLSIVVAMYTFVADKDLRDAAIRGMVIGMLALFSGFVTPDPMNGFSILPVAYLNGLIEWVESILNFEKVNQLRREIMAQEQVAYENRERLLRMLNVQANQLIRILMAQENRAHENGQRQLHFNVVPQYVAPHLEGG